MQNYSVIDLEGYARAMREAAAKSFADNYSENLDDFISITQVTNLIKKNSLGMDQEGYYIINKDILDIIFDTLRDWLYGVALAKLAAKGFVECAWDNDSNEMVFWLGNENKTKISAKPSDIN